MSEHDENATAEVEDSVDENNQTRDAAEAADEASTNEAADESGAAFDDRETLVAHVAAEDEALAQRVEEWLEEFEAATDERIDRLEEQLKRAQADFQNYKKRAKKRQNQLEDRATEDLVTQLLDVRDNLLRALDTEDGDVEALREGVELTLREFDHVLEGEQVAEIAPDPGSEVDPQRHEVLMRVESGQPEGTVADVYQPGYEMAGEVRQGAQVTVSDGGSESGETSGANSGFEFDDAE